MKNRICIHTLETPYKIFADVTQTRENFCMRGVWCIGYNCVFLTLNRNGYNQKPMNVASIRVRHPLQQPISLAFLRKIGR